jgi:acetyl-CoA carboxylase biotin carboxyl carrier protein
MAEGRSEGDAFNLEQLKRLMELMDRHGISLLDLQQGDARIRIRRGGGSPVALPTPLPGLPPSVPATAPAGTPPAKEEAATEVSIQYIKSPMVGTFYASPDPDADPFVRVGDLVKPETTVCLIEAMKVFNPIPAGVAGKILEVLVENGEPVDFGRPLFKVLCEELPPG